MYKATNTVFPADVEVYDIGTTDYRRLTSNNGLVAPTAISPPYLLMIRFLGLPDRFQNDFYIANLEALGVLDATGNLIPGDPVIDPP
jgi:hypothetical protein